MRVDVSATVRRRRIGCFFCARLPGCIPTWVPEAQGKKERGDDETSGRGLSAFADSPMTARILAAAPPGIESE